MQNISAVLSKNFNNQPYVFYSPVPFNFSRFCIVFFAATFFLFPACITLHTFLDEPTVKFERVEIEELNKSKIKLKIFFTAENNNFLSIPLRTIHYQVFIYDQMIYSDTKSEVYDLPANGKKTIGFPFEIDSKGIEAIFQGLRTSGEVRYAVKGFAEFPYFNLDFEQKGKVTIPDVQIKGIDVKEFSAQEIAFEMQVTVDNKNEFEIPIKSFDYAVSSGGREVFTFQVVQIKTIKANAVNEFRLPFRIKSKELIRMIKENQYTGTIKLVLDTAVDFSFQKARVQNEIAINLGKYGDDHIIRLLLDQLDIETK